MAHIFLWFVMSFYPNCNQIAYNLEEVGAYSVSDVYNAEQSKEIEKECGLQ